MSEIMNSDTRIIKPHGRKKITPVKREVSTSKKGHYIDRDMYLLQQQKSKDKDKINMALYKMFDLHIKNMLRMPCFSKYTYKDEMYSAALRNLYKYWKNFDSTESSFIFSYYTKCISRSFLQVIKKEKELQRRRDLLITLEGSNASFSFNNEILDEYKSKYESNDFDISSYNNRDDDEDNETKFSDNIEINDNELEYTELEDGSISVSFKNESNAEIKESQKHMECSPCIIYSGSQVVYDEELGYYVKKEK